VLNKISGNECNIPDHRSVNGESNNILPHVFVGDEAFVFRHILRDHILTKNCL